MSFDLSDRTILIVDDSAIMRMVITLHLRRFTKARIDEAVNGIEAIAMMARERYDLVISDINMPGMSGIELLRAIRAGSERDIPVILLTTKGEAKDRDIGMKLGADRYLTKPVAVKELLLAVYHLLGARQKRA